MNSSSDIKALGAGSKRKAEDLAPHAPKRIKVLAASLTVGALHAG